MSLSATYESFYLSTIQKCIIARKNTRGPMSSFVNLRSLKTHEMESYQIREGRKIRIKQYNSYAESVSSSTKESVNRRGSLINFFSPIKGSVLFVHGSCACLDQYERLIDQMAPYVLKKGYTCESFDAYGCGKSEKKKVYNMYAESELQKDLFAMYQKTKHSKVNYIVGHSYGTSQVIKLVNSLSLADKMAVKGIILIGGTLTGRDGGHPIMKLPSFMLSWIQPLLSKAFRSNAFHPDANPELLTEAEARSNSNPMFMCKYFYEQTKWVTVEEVSQIEVPALVIHGESDKILDVSGGRTLATALGAPIKVIPGTSHQCMEENPEAVAKEIVDFMSSS